MTNWQYSGPVIRWKQPKYIKFNVILETVLVRDLWSGHWHTFTYCNRWYLPYL